VYPAELFRIAGIGINLYLVFYSLALVPALALLAVLARERGLGGWFTADLAVAAMAGAYLGANLYGFLGLLAGSPMARASLSEGALPGGPWASLGGFAGALGAGFLFLLLHPRTRPAPLAAMDILVPALAAYAVVARLGCLAAGCCHGRPAFGLPWAVTFTDPASACIFRGIPVHPTQLYEALGCLALFALLLRLRTRPSFRGRLLGVFLLGYGLLRLVTECYRGDVRPMAGPFSLNQWIAIFLAILGLVCGGWIFRDRRANRDRT
jgi:phosphatidylglycerol---prolipoprotein diacylglyceryl transferase